MVVNINSILQVITLRHKIFKWFDQDLTLIIWKIYVCLSQNLDFAPVNFPLILFGLVLTVNRQKMERNPFQFIAMKDYFSF